MGRTVSSLRISRSALGRLEQLGTGGTAVVHRLPDLTLPGHPGREFVYKEYREKTRKAAGPSLGSGLENLVRFRGKLPVRQQTSWDDRIIWPVMVVTDAGDEVSGIVMPIIPDRFFQIYQRRSGQTDRRPREVDALFGDEETMRRVGLPDSGVVTRLRLILGIAEAYGMMHKEGVILGDISARNVVYDPDSVRPAVLVVDVDSARVRGTRSIFSSQPHTPGWEPPEALAAAARSKDTSLSPHESDQLRNTWAVQSTRTDVYKFGLLVIRILDHGRQRSRNRQPAAAAQILRTHIGRPAATLLERSVDADPAVRPSMREWYDVLRHGKGRERPSSGPAGRVAAGATQRVPQASRIPDGHRIGSFVWKEGTGWVRSASADPDRS